MLQQNPYCYSPYNIEWFIYTVARYQGKISVIFKAKKHMYKVSINDATFEVDQDGDSLFLGDKEFDWDLIKIGEGKYHIIYKTQSYNAELISISKDSKQVTLKIEDQVFTVGIKNKFDQLLEKMGMNDLVSAKLNEIKAPMPGLILSIEVQEGDEVKKGDSIMILEAMKMENVLKYPVDGIVKSILVKQGISVEKNQVLINF